MPLLQVQADFRSSYSTIAQTHRHLYSTISRGCQQKFHKNTKSAFKSAMKHKNIKQFSHRRKPKDIKMLRSLAKTETRSQHFCSFQGIVFVTNSRINKLVNGNSRLPAVAWLTLNKLVYVDRLDTISTITGNDHNQQPVTSINVK